MSLTFSILGAPGSDNALLLQADSGQSVERLLFDCGEGCLSDLALSDVLAIDHLFFSHLHMDHVAGFDTFFRCTFNRDSRPNRVWGPPETARILQHRFQGFLWNLHEEMSASWLVSDISPREIRTTRFELREAFSAAHDAGTRPFDCTVEQGAGFSVDAFTMDHRTPTLAYVIREKARRNIDTSRLAALGLRPGPWLKQLKESPSEAPLGDLLIEGVTCSLEELRENLIIETPGDSIAYLTDFALDEPAMERLSHALRGCATLICEAQYRHADLELARRNYHLTTVLAATLAQRAGARQLVLFHLSDRYQHENWIEMLREARQIFPNTHFPPHWALDS